MPSLLGVEDVESPAHHLAGLDGGSECGDLDGVLGVSVAGARCEEVEGALVGAPGLELDDPVLADVLVVGVVVHVLLLGVVDARDLRPVDLHVPGVRVDVSRPARNLVQFLSLIEADLFWVGCHLEGVAVGLHRGALDGAVDELGSVG